jgi:large subunit ribosomal protein L18e
MMNSELKRVIRILNTESKKGGKAIWRALADDLNSPKRSRISVNLSRINRNTESGDIVAIPGKVLASGSLSHPLTVAAFSFSNGARQKITQSGSKAIFLVDLLEEKIEPSNIKIIK